MPPSDAAAPALSSQNWKAYAEEPAAIGDYQTALDRWREALKAGQPHAEIYVARYIALSGTREEAKAALSGRDFTLDDDIELGVALTKLRAPGLEAAWLRAATEFVRRTPYAPDTANALQTVYARLARLGFVIQLDPPERELALSLLRRAQPEIIERICFDRKLASGLVAAFAAYGDLEAARLITDQFGLGGRDIARALNFLEDAVNAGAIEREQLDLTQAMFSGAAPASSKFVEYLRDLLRQDQPWRAEALFWTLVNEGNDEQLDEIAAEIAAHAIEPALGLTRAMVRTVAKLPARAANTMARGFLDRGFKREAARMLASHLEASEQAAYAHAVSHWGGAPENRDTLHWRRSAALHDTARLSIGLAHAIADELDYAGAEAILRDAAKAGSDGHATTWRPLASFFERTGQFARWEELIATLEASFPNDAWVASERLKHDFETRGRADVEAAERAAEAKVKKAPDLMIRRALAIRMPIEGRNEESAELWSEIATTRDTVNDHYHYILAIFRTGRFDDAIAHLKRVIQRFPGDYRLHLKMAQASERLGDYEATLANYTRAFATEPFNADSNAGIARALTYLGRHDDCEAWLASFPQDEVRSAWVHSARAFNEARTGNLRGAKEALARVCTIMERFDDAYQDRLALNPSTVWLDGKYQRHPAASAPTHARRFAEDISNMRASPGVALVGNAPQLLGQSKGAAIDATGYVIRLNDFKTEGYEQDVGARTDLWYSSANRLARPNIGQASLQRIWIYQPYGPHFPELPDFAQARLGLPLTEATATYLPPHIHTLTARLIYPRPSTGFRMIALLEFFVRRAYKIAGFSFFQGAALHYFDAADDNRLQVGEVHAIDFERDFVDQVLAPCGFLDYI